MIRGLFTSFVSESFLRRLPALAAALGVATGALAEMPETKSLDTNTAIAIRTPLTQLTKRSLHERMTADPLAFLKEAKENFEKTITDYTCTFSKQEVILGKMSEKQQMAVKCRHQPYSVLLDWTHNADQAKRALYVKDKIVGKKGEQYALVEPAGWLARLVVASVQRDIHGIDARKYARRAMDQFGFVNTLDLVIQFSDIAKASGELDLKYVGDDKVDGRPTYKFERRLPYAGENSKYPDALLVVHMDQEWLVPTKCESFADQRGQKLLGRYVLTDVDLNAGLSAADFNPDTLGF
jgi:hypothetical protein